jgi:hypothetical protein
MQKMMYLLVSQHVSGIIMPLIRRMVQNRPRQWCTALAVLQRTRGEEVVVVHLLGMVSRLSRETIPNKCTTTTSSPRVYCSTASAVHHRRCRFCTILLMMSTMMPETC